MADAVGNAEPVVIFSVGEDSVSVDMESVESAPTNDGQGDGLPPRSTSRFKVAKVEFVDEPASESDSECGTSPPANGVVPRDGARVRDRLNSDSTLTSSHHPVEGTYSYDTNNLKTFGQNTLESLPHADHYRNLLSATGAMMRKRPTLLELHEHDKDVSHCT